ncbi:MAG: hypothetical protein K2K17_07040 [Lachnospiraceae bacterium]|nr:hypothetical protein [Lachnospiraceae bacterium]
MKFLLFASLIAFCLFITIFLRLPILPIVIIFIIILTISINNSNKKMKQQTEKFWEKEHKANFVRKKPLDGLTYLTIPEHFLSMPVSKEDTHALDALDMLKHLSSQKIVNLTGITNTDLKLTYGTANITVLTQYDQNYTQLAHALQQLADSLAGNDHPKEAMEVLEYAISTRTDISASYLLLADLYITDGHPEKIESLINTASSLDTLLAPSIVRNLKSKTGE